MSTYADHAALDRAETEPRGFCGWEHGDLDAAWSDNGTVCPTHGGADTEERPCQGLGCELCGALCQEECRPECPRMTDLARTRTETKESVRVEDQ